MPAPGVPKVVFCLQVQNSTCTCLVWHLKLLLCPLDLWKTEIWIKNHLELLFFQLVSPSWHNVSLAGRFLMLPLQYGLYFFISVSESSLPFSLCISQEFFYVANWYRAITLFFVCFCYNYLCLLFNFNLFLFIFLRCLRVSVLVIGQFKKFIFIVINNLFGFTSVSLYSFLTNV